MHIEVKNLGQFLDMDRLLRFGFNQIIKRLPPSSAIFPSPETARIASRLNFASETLHQTAWNIFFDNLTAVGDEVFLSANKKEEYPDMWLRDSMMAAEFIDDPLLEAKILRSFEKRQLPDGHIPTAVAIKGKTPWHFADDESTMLYIIWSARLAQKTKGGFLPDITTVDAAMSFVRNHAKDGKYRSTKGERKSWLDSFIFDEGDVITQNQGLYAVTLLALQELSEFYGKNLLRETDNIQTAEKEYRDLAKNGYLPLSDKYDKALDASVLYPEYLAKTIFDKFLLDKKTVEETFRKLPRKDGRIMVLTQSPAGDYFDSSQFYNNYEPGNYQNGGIWLPWENNALMVARLHGIEISDYNRQAEAINRKIEESNWAECINSDGSILKPRQLWNLAILAQQRNVNRLFNRVL